jgi:hypothetical protein
MEINTMNENGENNPVCIEDFCGYSEPGHFPVQYWADWYPQTGFCYFGGDWSDVYPHHFHKQPTAEQAAEYVKAARIV